MNTITLNTTKSIRFRRWTRAGYAVFNSLGNCVTIGNLVGSISEKSLQKSVSSLINKLSVDNPEIDSDEKAKEKSELESALLEIQIVTLTKVAFDTVAARSYNTTKYFIHHSG